VGYVSDASFCKAFKRAFGQSPGAYRRLTRHGQPSHETPASPLERRRVLAGKAA